MAVRNTATTGLYLRRQKTASLSIQRFSVHDDMKMEDPQIQLLQNILILNPPPQMLSCVRPCWLCICTPEVVPSVYMTTPTPPEVPNTHLYTSTQLASTSMSQSNTRCLLHAPLLPLHVLMCLTRPQVFHWAMTRYCRYIPALTL